MQFTAPAGMGRRSDAGALTHLGRVHTVVSRAEHLLVQQPVNDTRLANVAAL